MYLFHILENIGMSIGIMPVTGIPTICQLWRQFHANKYDWSGIILNIYVRKKIILDDILEGAGISP